MLTFRKYESQAFLSRSISKRRTKRRFFPCGKHIKKIKLAGYITLQNISDFKGFYHYEKN
jgi:hypothetical protein